LVFLPFLVHSDGLFVSLDLLLRACFSDTTWHETNHHLIPPSIDTILTLLIVTLQVLNLCNCALEECTFAGDLRIMGCLAELNLSQNHISDKGVASLSDSLEACVCLRHLDLSNNYFGGKYAVKVGEMLEHNRGLLSLNLSSNCGIYQMWNSIAVGLMKNTTLMQLNLTMCDLTLQAGERIYEALSENKVCEVNLDLNALPDVLRLTPRKYRRDGLPRALKLARNAPGVALVTGQTWRKTRLNDIMVSKDAVKTLVRLQDPDEREPLNWDRGALENPPTSASYNADNAAGGGGGEGGDVIAPDTPPRLENSVMGEPSLFGGSLSLSAMKENSRSIAEGTLYVGSPDKSLLESLVAGGAMDTDGTKDGKGKRRKKGGGKKGGNGDGDGDESIAAASQHGGSTIASADFVSVGARDQKAAQVLHQKLDNAAIDDNQGRLILSVCYGRASEQLGTIEVDVHTTYPEAKELITPLVREYLAALGNLKMTEILVRDFEVLDPDRRVVHGEKSTVRSVWTEACVNDHNLFVRPANWIGMVDEEELEVLEDGAKQRQGKFKQEEFVSVEYDDNAFHEGNGDDDMSAISDEGLYEDTTTSLTAGSYASQRHYFGEIKTKKKKEEKWV
jgi:hypothetical protein